MKEEFSSTKLILEEKKNIKLLLWLFYIIYFTYEAFDNFVVPVILKKKSIDNYTAGLGLWLYLLIVGLLIPSVYLLKKGKVYHVKYLFIIGYVLIDFVNNLLIYGGTSKPFESGNIVELLFVLYCPIFVNKKYFWTVGSLMVGKYLLIGVILRSDYVILPTILFLVFLCIVFIILNRFKSYIYSLTNVYDELRKKERLAVIGQMAAAIGHEIRNPLASLKGFTQLQRESYPNTNEFYPIMIQEIDRINLIVDDLMYLGKPKKIHFEKESIEEIMAYTLSISLHQAQDFGVVIETEKEGLVPPIDCDGKQLKQVFINIIKNAIESMPEGGKLKINMKVPGNQNRLLISFQDEGCGISDDCISKLGEPFYTTKRDGNGLGLMITNQIIKDHNGKMKIQSNLGIGTTIKILLPLNQEFD